MNLFKGYIETKDKKAVEKFKNRTDFKSYKQIKNMNEFAGVLNDETALIDIDDYEQSEILLNIVDSKGLKCRVYGTKRGKHFLFRNSGLDSCKTHTKLACGLTADIKLGIKNSYEILKYDGVEREILYDKLDDEEYDEVPKWLLPLQTTTDFTTMEKGDGRNQALFNYILTLQSNDFSVDESRECIEIINDFVLADPLDKDELEVILRDDAFSKPIFFKNGTFLFDTFAKYLVSQHHIIKINGQLHFYKDGIYVNGNSQIEGLMIDYIPNLNRTKRKEVLDYLSIMIKNNTEQSNASYIAFKNGVYNIETEKFMPFSPDIIVVNKIDHNYNADAYCEIVDKVLNKMSCNDKGIRALLEEVVGYTFYRRNELRKAFILIGDKSMVSQPTLIW